ncbi:hypothetical protein [uncultured Microbacterium sp.]|uniref:hypothetical protein n=1 Tax=uncultured Microbacterium sp. TaxID=191216 RepID=UPI003749D44B
MVTVWPEPEQDTDADEAAEVETGECPTCGPDQVPDMDGLCSWCGRPLRLCPDFRDDPSWWRE